MRVTTQWLEVLNQRFGRTGSGPTARLGFYDVVSNLSRKADSGNLAKMLRLTKGIKNNWRWARSEETGGAGASTVGVS